MNPSLVPANLDVFYVFPSCLVSRLGFKLFAILTDPCHFASNDAATLLTGHTRDEWHPNMEYICPTSMVVVVNGRVTNNSMNSHLSPIPSVHARLSDGFIIIIIIIIQPNRLSPRARGTWAQCRFNLKSSNGC